MGYIYLLLAVASSSMGNIAMKKANGFKNKLATITAIILYAIVPAFLILSIQYFEIGMTYAIWSGGSILVVAILGIIFFKENKDIKKFIGLIFITIGVVCLQIANN
ncbi:DMT family transporter [Bacillus cereus]|uniref:DMT family transporter n=1 Tax=Bacillus cereus TaxID=1396 RepID=UPI001E5C678F|nr:SMR family transporter [Bacillus cereus]MCD2338319.1 SMR family transporter [Bacillus cereus]